MVYDPHTYYKITDFKSFTPSELQILFKEAKVASNNVRGSKLIRKVDKDISTMRRLLNGFDSIYNEAHK